MLQLKYLLPFILLLVACSSHTDNPQKSKVMNTHNNKFSYEDLKWLNNPTSIALDNGVRIVAGEKTDFFVNPETGENSHSAPLLYREEQGDFVATVRVEPDFSEMWNAACLMMHSDSTHWIKFAFERSDATGKSIVSVVTDGVSDDANGVILEDQDEIWLKLLRKGSIFSMLWSLDGSIYKMARLTKMELPDVVKIGIEAQCPVGKEATHNFYEFNVENISVNDVRKGE